MLVLRNANGNIATHRAVFGLIARVRRDVAAGAEIAVVRGTIVDVVVRPTPGEVAVLPIAIFSTDPAADLDAHVSAGNVVEAHPIQAADLDVLNGLRLDGKIGRLRSSCCNQTSC